VNTAERNERNAEIVAARKAGEQTGSIARRFGITERQARRILAEHRDDPARELVEDPVEILERTLAALDEEKEKLAQIAATTTSDWVRQKAITARVRVLGRKTALIQSVGLMPPPHVFRHDLEVTKFAEIAVDIFHRYDVPHEAVEEILSLAREATGHA